MTLSCASSRGSFDNANFDMKKLFKCSTWLPDLRSILPIVVYMSVVSSSMIGMIFSLKIPTTLESNDGNVSKQYECVTSIGIKIMRKKIPFEIPQGWAFVFAVLLWSSSAKVTENYMKNILRTEECLLKKMNAKR